MALPHNTKIHTATWQGDTIVGTRKQFADITGIGYKAINNRIRNARRLGYREDQLMQYALDYTKPDRNEVKHCLNIDGTEHWHTHQQFAELHHVSHPYWMKLVKQYGCRMTEISRAASRFSGHKPMFARDNLFVMFCLNRKMAEWHKRVAPWIEKATKSS